MLAELKDTEQQLEGGYHDQDDDFFRMKWGTRFKDWVTFQLIFKCLIYPKNLL